MPSLSAPATMDSSSPSQPAAAPVSAAQPAPAPVTENPLATALRGRMADVLAAERDDAWALSACEVLESVADNEVLLKNNAELRAAARTLVDAANADVDFTHCYLSVSEDVLWALRGVGA